MKNVYASKKKVGKRYPNGTVIVKSIRRAGDTASRPAQVAVMRKTNGTWRYVEYELSGTRYRDLGFSAAAVPGLSHAGARQRLRVHEAVAAKHSGPRSRC